MERQATHRAWHGPALVAAYLASVVAANVGVAVFGPAAVLVSSWVVIPFDLTLKDALQERWTGQQVAARLGALVLAGSLLSAVLVGGTGHIAAASFAAFAVAGAVDGMVLHGLRGKHVLVRVNGSNVAGAVVDSFVFQLVAFQQAVPELVVGQAASKSLGGLVWSVVLARLLSRR
jgi:uncharacterized PurR-regulated membrane protein YhhQ (DUF165 family)